MIRPVSTTHQVHWWWGAASATVLVFWVATMVYTALKLRTETVSTALQTASLHAHSLEDSFTQSLQSVELLSSAVEPRLVQPVNWDNLAQELNASIRSMPYLRSLSVTDEMGKVLSSSNPDNIGKSVAVDTMYPRASADIQVLRLGNLTHGRDWHDQRTPSVSATDSVTFVPVAQPVSVDQRHYWIVASLNPDHFITRAQVILQQSPTHVHWVRYDGAPLWTSMAGLSFQEQEEEAQNIAQWVVKEEIGRLEHRYPQGPSTLTAYRASAKYPAVLSVDIDRDAILARWQRDTQRRALIATPLLLAVLGLGWYVWRRQHLLMEQEAQLAEQRLLASRVFESASDAILVTTPDARIVSVNPSFERLTGYSATEVMGQNPRILGSGTHPLGFFEGFWQALATEGVWHGQVANRRKNGQLYLAEASVNAITDDWGNVHHYAGVLSDITEHKRAEEKLLLAASVFSHAQEAIMITDPDGTMIEVNDAFLRITGYERHEVLGHNTSMLSSGRQPREFYQAMWAALAEKGRWTGEIWNRRKSGEVYAELLTISAVNTQDGQVLRYVALFSDITQQKEHEQQLERIAHFDALTGLPNRVLLSDRLHQAMSHAVRRGNTLAVVFLDLDGFKSINDAHGHATGDQLLMALSVRMKQALRDGDTLARLGGDEFVAVLQDLPDHEACVPVLERLRLAAAQPVVLDSTQALQVSASLGLAFFPQADEVDADQLLRQADQAMYQAKVSGKNRYHVFDAQHDRTLRHRHESLEAIRQALATDQLQLYYQPKVNMRTGQVIGAEALIRWNHPVHGLLGPSAFLPSIESHPLGIELGQWVLAQAAQQISLWKSQGLHLPVSANLDAQQLQDHGLVDSLRELLKQHPQLQPGDLRLEVLETTALNDMAQVSDVMNACQREGVDFALDDFGTGYSSLTYLRRLPARELKIDQSFVRNMLDDADDLAILQGVLGLARAFQREVIAEGVETVAHGSMLLRMGCEHAQGYAIARPMPAADIPLWCLHWQPDPSWRHLTRVHTDDLPALFAAAEHRGWLSGVHAYLRGERDIAPALADDTCHFGQWLRGIPDNHRFRGSGLLVDVDLLHRQVHAMATSMMNAMANGHPCTTDRWAALEQVSHQLLDCLMHLVESPPPQS